MLSLADDPIIACSTGLKENTAIALIRLSGFESLDFFQKFIRDFESYLKYGIFS